MACQYLRGEKNIALFPVKSAVAIAKGDFLYVDSADGYTVKPAGSMTWQSAVSAASTPTITNTTTTLATGLTNAVTGCKVSYQFPWGEGTLSAAGTATPTANAGLMLTGVALPSPAIGLNVYVESAAGSGTYLLYGQYAGIQGAGPAAPTQLGIGNQLIMGYGRGNAPPTAAAQDATAISQFYFRNRFVGVADQDFAGETFSTVPLQYGLQDGKISVCTSGVFLVDMASATQYASDLMGLAKQSGNLLEPQKVVAVTGENLAVGRLVKSYGSSKTQAEINIFPPVSRVNS